MTFLVIRPSLRGCPIDYELPFAESDGTVRMSKIWRWLDGTPDYIPLGIGIKLNCWVDQDADVKKVDANFVGGDLITLMGGSAPSNATHAVRVASSEGMEVGSNPIEDLPFLGNVVFTRRGPEGQDYALTPMQTYGLGVLLHALEHNEQDYSALDDGPCVILPHDVCVELGLSSDLV